MRVALTPEQVRQYGLPEYPGKSTDTRARGFEQRHGTLVQVEVDALPPDVLRDLYRNAFWRFFDESIYRGVTAVEGDERERLCELADTYQEAAR